MSRTPFIAGNWKMHKTATEAGPFAAALGAQIGAGVEVGVCVPFTALAATVAAAEGTPLRVFAQNMHQAPAGAYTGEISAGMLLDLGTHGVLLGHSERRQYFNESDAALAEKLTAAHEAGLEVILAVGETEAERRDGVTEAVLERQMSVLSVLSDAQVAATTIAYEPVWAIGTGLTATPDIAQAAHAHIRALAGAAGDRVRIQYGGSMKPENAESLLAQPDIDGGLIGGASLDVDSFLAIVDAAR